MKTVHKQWDTQFEGKVIEKQETFPITLSCTCTCVVNPLTPKDVPVRH